MVQAVTVEDRFDPRPVHVGLVVDKLYCSRIPSRQYHSIMLDTLITVIYCRLYSSW